MWRLNLHLPRCIRTYTVKLTTWGLVIVWGDIQLHCGHVWCCSDAWLQIKSVSRFRQLNAKVQDNLEEVACLRFPGLQWFIPRSTQRDNAIDCVFRFKCQVTTESKMLLCCSSQSAREIYFLLPHNKLQERVERSVGLVNQFEVGREKMQFLLKKKLTFSC